MLYMYYMLSSYITLAANSSCGACRRMALHSIACIFSARCNWKTCWIWGWSSSMVGAAINSRTRNFIQFYAVACLIYELVVPLSTFYMSIYIFVKCEWSHARCVLMRKFWKTLNFNATFAYILYNIIYKYFTHLWHTPFHSFFQLLMNR